MAEKIAGQDVGSKLCDVCLTLLSQTGYLAKYIAAESLSKSLNFLRDLRLFSLQVRQ